jgi:hypothetical protein
MSSARRLAWEIVLIAVVSISASGCIFPGAGTLLEKGFAEARGGRGESKHISPLPEGPTLDRFRAFKIARVERSADAGPMPDALLGVVESELKTAIVESGLFPGSPGPGPTLLIRTRLTTHWPATGLSQAYNAHSEILARVEFVEDGRRGPLGIYYVRGVSNAIARKSDQDLGKGLASAVLELIGMHRTPAPGSERLAEQLPVER